MTTPVEATLKLDEVKVNVFAPVVKVEAAAPVKLSAPEELSVTTPVPWPMLLVPVEESVLNAPVETVVAPIAVELIPVAVVLKLLDVNVKALAPVLIDEAPSPERVKAPEVAVRLSAPVVCVKPFEAANNPAEVIVPVPVVEILFEVLMVLAVAIVPKPEAIEPEVSAPTEVKEELTTVPLSVVPVNVPAAAVTVMFVVPSNETPLMVRAVCRAVAVAALPVVEPEEPVMLPEIGLVTVRLVKVPTLVSDEAVTPAARVVPWISEAALTLMLALGKV